MYIAYAHTLCTHAMRIRYVHTICTSAMHIALGTYPIYLCYVHTVCAYAMCVRYVNPPPRINPRGIIRILVTADLAGNYSGGGNYSDFGHGIS